MIFHGTVPPLHMESPWLYAIIASRQIDRALALFWIRILSLSDGISRSVAKLQRIGPFWELMPSICRAMAVKTNDQEPPQATNGR
ncbi:hypothetical protein MESS4_790046 [Mesorhizobium sp. STM 4661]|nr:hypothetical protein MESS4_790046 [Mesorhizobium sp. STM 4661]